MKKVLIIQSYANQVEAEDERQDYMRTIGDHAAITFISSLNKFLPWHTPEEIVSGYDAVIVGGSSDFDFDGGREASDLILATSHAILERMRPTIDHVIQNAIPCMGICYGHQMIGLSQGGTLHNDLEQNKLGSFEVTLTEEGQQDALFKNLPLSFVAQYIHKDSLTSLPTGATLLGTGERCRFSVLRYGSNCYTTQFHTEFGEKEMQVAYPEQSNDFKPSLEASLVLPTFLDIIK